MESNSLNRIVDDETARQIAEGEIDPMTKVKYSEIIKPRTQFQPKGVSKKRNFFEMFLDKSKPRSLKNISDSPSNSSNQPIFDPFESKFFYKKVVKIDEEDNPMVIRTEKKGAPTGKSFLKTPEMVRQEASPSESVFKNKVRKTAKPVDSRQSTSVPEAQKENSTEAKNERKVDLSFHNKLISAFTEENSVPGKTEEKDDLLDLDEEINKLLNKQ